MKTLEEASNVKGVTLEEAGDTKWLNLHFDPLPNWYGCILGFDCPRCGNAIDWEWQGKMPSFTNEESTRHLAPITKGSSLIAFGHRWIRLKCDNCQTNLCAENFD